MNILKLSYFIIVLMTVLPAHAGIQSDWQQSQDYEKKGDYRKAISVINNYTGTIELGELAMMRIAWLYYQNKDYSRSVKYYAKALRRNPYSMDSRLGLTLVYMAQERWKDVKKETKRIIAADPWNYTAHVRLMIAENIEKDWATLARHARELSKRYPANTDPWLYLGRAESWRYKREKALEAYRRLLALEPANSEAASYIAGKYIKK